MTTETMTDLITAEEAKKLAHKYRFANNDLERVLCETARTVIALRDQLADAEAAMAAVVERAADSLLECSVWCDSQERADANWHNGVVDARKHFMARIRDFAPIDGLALVRELRAERDRFEAALGRACLVGGTTYLVERAEKAEAERDRLSAENAALKAKVAGLRAAFRVNMLRFGPPGTTHEEIDAAIDAALATQEAGTC